MTIDQVGQLIHALDAAARWVTNAESSTAWTRAIALVCSSSAQTIKDSFATPVIVNKFPQLAPHATTAESVRWLTRAIFNITNGTTQATRDAFACAEIVATFSQLAPHATTADSVQELTMAIVTITYSEVPTATDKAKDAFAVPAIVEIFPQLAPYATTAESVQWLATAINYIADSPTQSVKDAFATPSIVAMFTQLAPYATTVDSVRSLTHAINNITIGTTVATKDAFATPEVVAMFTQLAPHATTAESVQSLITAIIKITLSLTQNTKDAFATPAIVAMFSLLAPRATTAAAVLSLSMAICNITDGTNQTRRGLFATPTSVNMFPQLAHYAATEETVNWLAVAIGMITSGMTQTTKDAFATPDIVKMFTQLAPRVTTADSVLQLARAIHNITSGTTQATKDVFADPALASALRSLTTVAITNESRSILEAALAVASVHRANGPRMVVEGPSGAASVASPESAVAHSGVDCISRLATISFPADYRPPCNAQDAILQCGLSRVSNLPLIAGEAAAIAADRLARLPPTGGPVRRLDPDLAVAIAAYTYDLGFSSTDPTGAGSDNFYWCLNTALHQRAQNGGALVKLKPILYYLFRGLEALPAAVDKVVYRGVPSSCTDVVRQLYLTGANVYWTSFTSASEGIDAATQFASTEGAGGVIFRITSQTGRYVHSYSSTPREGEVIFSPNSSFTVSKGPHDEVLPNSHTMCVVDLIERRQDNVVY